jgi:hypothetical protein
MSNSVDGSSVNSGTTYIENNVPTKIEQLTSNEVISCLYSKNASEKCRVGLADVVLYDGISPVSWYVTGKAGEVMKKRGIDMNIIAKRWQKFATQSESSIVAIMRQKGGIIKLLSADALVNFLSEKNSDPSIVSLHCFVRSRNQVQYRNRFALRDLLGRVTTSTHSYPLRTSRDEPEAPVLAVLESELPLSAIRSGGVRGVMDLCTATLVRYIEMVLSARVLSLSVDYVIDSNSQIWMLWANECRLVRGVRGEKPSYSPAPPSLAPSLPPHSPYRWTPRTWAWRRTRR